MESFYSGDWWWSKHQNAVLFADASRQYSSVSWTFYVHRENESNIAYMGILS